LKDYKKAREYFKEALRVAERTKDGNILLYSNNNIGFTYLKQQRVKDAETYFLKALEAAKSVNNTNWHATAFSGLAQVNLLLKNETTALQLFKRALAFREQIGDLNGISEIYYFLSLMNLDKIKIDSAFYYARLSQQIAIAIKARNRELENYELFKKLHQQNGRYDSALYYQEQFTSLSDSLFNENLARNLAEIQLSIQSEENNQVLAAKELALQRKAVLTNFLLVVIRSVLTLAATIFWFYRKQRRLSNSLSQKNTEIMNQTEEIPQQRETLVMTNEELERARRKIVQQNERLEEFNKDLQATVLVRTQELELANRALRIVNLELDNFIYKSSHDMKGPLARLLGICHVALMDVHDEKAREYFTMLAQTSRQLNDIFDRLRAVSDINSRELQKDKIFFDKIIEKVLDRLKSVKGYENMVFDIRVADDIDYVSDEFLIETIFYNMLENAIKFQKQSLAEGDAKFVKLRVKTKKKKIIASFTDNGIGIEHHETDHIFDMFSKAALKHQTVGLGLYIVKQSLTKINGSIALVKSDGERTKFEIELPYL
jgi:signal transduction histidine kinase